MLSLRSPGLASLLALLGLALPLPGRAGEPAPGDGKPAFGVSVRLDSETVEPGKALAAHVEIRNVSAEKRTFKVMSATWGDHWRSTSPFVAIPPEPADKNFPQEIEIAPGGDWRRDLGIEIKPGAPERLSFRLAFRPFGWERWVFLSDPLEVRVAGGSGPEPAPALEVSVKPGRTEVKAGEALVLTLSVRNASDSERTIVVQSHAWAEEWASTCPRLWFPAPDVRKNYPKRIALKPGEAWTVELEVRILPGGEAGRLSFRMCFLPLDPPTAFLGGEAALTVVE